MSYQLTIKGENEPVIVSDEDGMKINAIKLDKRITNDTSIPIGNEMTIEKGKISFIRKIKETPKNTQIADSNEEHRKLYLSWRDRTPEEKATRNSMFKALYKIIHGTEAAKNVLESLRLDLISFFESNPMRTYANGTTYLKWLNAGKSASTAGHSLIRMMEKVIYEDMQDAKFNPRRS